MIVHILHSLQSILIFLSYNSLCLVSQASVDTAGVLYKYKDNSRQTI